MGECSAIQSWFEGLFYSVFGGMIILFIYAGLDTLIRSNWKKANKRAKSELKKRNKT